MRLYFLYFLTFVAFPSLGQQNDLYPDLYTTYFYNPGLINPAFVAKEGKADFFVFYKQRTAPFEKVASYAFIGSKIFRNKNNSAHLVRGFLMNEKDGPYIGKPRFYVNYAYSMPIDQNTFVSAGLALGMAQVSFSAPSATAFGSFKSPDASLGLMLTKKKFSCGISMMQALNSFSKPLNSPITFRRYFNFFLSQKRELSPEWGLTGNLLWQVFPEIKDGINGNLFLTYKDLFSFGSGMGSKNGMVFFISFNIAVGNERVIISFAYNSPFLRPALLPVNSVELNGAYTFN